MCSVGYYADHFGTTFIDNGTDVIVGSKDNHKIHHISNLTYVGPIFMGLGVFIVVVACVVVFETRDKIIQDALSNHSSTKPRKPDFYDKIIDEFKKPGDVRSKEGKTNAAFQSDEVTAKLAQAIRSVRDKRRSSFRVSSALKRISSEIFAININASQNQHTLLPININLSLKRSHMLPGIKRPFHGSTSTTDEVTAKGLYTQELKPREESYSAPLGYFFDSGRCLDDRYTISNPPKSYSDDISHDTHELIELSSKLSSQGKDNPAFDPYFAEETPAGGSADFGISTTSILVTVHRPPHQDGSESSSKEDQSVECSFESDSFEEGTKRPGRRKSKYFRDRMNIFESGHMATLSVVTPEFDSSSIVSSTSDDDSLHLTEEIMRNFDMTPVEMSDFSCPGTTEISFASETTANTLETLDMSDADDILRALTPETTSTGKGEFSFYSEEGDQQ